MLSLAAPHAKVNGYCVVGGRPFVCSSLACEPKTRSARNARSCKTWATNTDNLGVEKHAWANCEIGAAAETPPRASKTRDRSATVLAEALDVFHVAAGDDWVTVM